MVEEGLLGRACKTIGNLLTGRKVFIIADSTVWKLWGEKLLRGLKPLKAPVILVTPGERFKRLETVEKIADELAFHGAERSSLLLVVGGGVTGDMGSFAAAIYLRGIDYIHIPTTLLAQVDSAIGGKTGVNLGVGKNLVGAFYQPKMVLSDIQVLRTLPERELRAGLFESIKCGVIGDPELFQFLETQRKNILRGNPESLGYVIHASAALKGRIVSQDEKESDLRRVLNFGHTLGHALEAATNYRRFLHGEAVAWGMLAATRLAVNINLLAHTEALRIASLIHSYGPVPSLRSISSSSVVKHMKVDKKVRDGQIHFVLPEKIGKVRIVSGISPQQAIRVFEELQGESPLHTSGKLSQKTPSSKISRHP